MDWSKLISELRAAGLTQQEIATSIGKSQAWVSDVQVGHYTDLKWRDGNALIALHRVTTHPGPNLAIEADR